VTVEQTRQPAAVAIPAHGIERNGINVIAEDERRGRSRQLFWPWCAANISVLGLSYGSFLLGFRISFWQATLAAVLGSLVSFLLVGLVSLAGKRGSAPTMVLSRAAFGVRGNGLPAAVSYVALVGWETIVVALATLATSTVFARLGAPSGVPTKLAAFVVVAGVIVLLGVRGFGTIMAVQRVLTVALAALTVVYLVLVRSHFDRAALAALPHGSFSGVLGAAVLVAAALGVSWANAGADYSRYLPRATRGTGVVWWTTVGGGIAPALLLIAGVGLAGSDPQLAGAIATDPIGALATVLPTWFLVPFVLVAVGGLVAGAALDIYSSGLALLTLGVPLERWKAAALDGVLMVLGGAYVVFVATNVIVPFQGFLITLGVPLAGWCGVFLADLALRRRHYDDDELFRVGGRYGSVGVSAVGAMVLAAVVGWGLVTNPLWGALSWQGYLLEPFGLGARVGGPWSSANLGVVVALAIGFVVQLVFGNSRVRRQEAVPGATAAAGAPAAAES
jgi:purine-cytosine permease-like protein